MPETAVAPAAPQPVTVIVQDQAKADAAAREAADAKAWKDISGEEPEGNDIPTPDFEKLEAEGKTTKPGHGPDGKFVKADKTATEESSPKGDLTREKSEDTSDSPQKPSDKKPEPKKDDKPLDRDTRRKIIAAKEIVGRVLKYDDDKLEAMGHEELIDLGQRLKPTFKVVQDLQSDLQKWKDRARGQKPTDTDTPDNGRGRTAEPDDKADPEPAEREEGGIDKLLSDYLDPETLKAVNRARLAERSKIQNQATKIAERAQAAETLLVLDRLEMARDRVAEKFPQLKDDQNYDRFLNAMEQMDPGNERLKGDRASFLKFAERVAWSEFGEDVERTTRQRLITGNRRDANTQPETTSHGSQPTAMTWDEYENYAGWAAVEAGGNTAKMQALMAKVKKPARPK